MDRIIKSYLHNFIEEFGYENKQDILSENFEKFCSYLVISDELPNQGINSEDIDNVSVGKNKGIDSICIIVNGKLISSIQEIEDLFDINRYIESTLIFIQTKTSEKFDDSEIGNFGDTIKDYLSEKPQYELTKEAKESHEILLYLYDNFANVRNLDGIAFFCTTGKWKDNTSCQKTLLKKINEIKNCHNVFKERDFTIKPLGNSELQKLFDKVNSASKAEFLFRNKISLDNIPSKIKEAYYGSLPFPEFKKIIIDSESGKLRSLFYDNVRDDLGENNPVNADIAKTLDGKGFSIFSLLNNGVTIIAEENKGGGNKFILSNFQIVNGCQTSNVLYKHRDLKDIDKLIVPIKLIITTDEEIKDKIILATNNQTEIKEEQRMALTNFHKGLEKFYSSMKEGIHYERRANQYANSSIKKKNIVSLREQIKSFVAMFMEEPNLVSGYFGKIYRDKKGKIFVEEHKFEPYYLSGLIQFKFKDLLNKKEIDRKYNKARYHIFMLFRKIFEPSEFNIEMLKQKRIISYINSLFEKLREEDVKSNFEKVLALIDKSGIDIEKQKEIYKKSTTNTLITIFNQEYK
jgi:hypothetical protein